MPETSSHERAKAKAAGRRGETEIPVRGECRLDAATERRATEVERSGSCDRLKAAAQRLQASGKPQKVLQVPQEDMDKAARAMREVGVSGTVKNMSGIKRRHVDAER